MKNARTTTVKILMAIGLVGTMISCKSTFNANETLQVDENRNAIYQEIISNPVQLTNFISEAQKSEAAKKLMMQAHMAQMESGNMKMMMEKNPEMKEKMQSHMQMMMEENPEMMQKMYSKMLNKMMENEKDRKMLMDEIHSNKMMKKDMKAMMMQLMNENPEMKEEMKEKNPEMMKKMKNEGQ
ncbi:hypothetical protein ESY86_02765 [Subsaximicrobium wynnwilliamsii]|uniref:DUF4175 domain-containing protein n=1 Tax=Subsaximicrobium wynnwilliamsii TaxID=291179 RepID=A0A5C6ZPF5_9FLAO|nr:hypothetical protein [Subsaximicrobium wynnwilliamsii]TXD85543.1 hypothetical protein ESY87_01075 [Subsaximicrobium wynnwilliamsii]TXD90896.1 hypothetical protein ESY86_02765 [Subsaximicrobium wynnwilliamsii]TXE05403.1 hypothetical protein ESY88_01075 [Subsaximicrobium wynnwilliamsii]